MKRRRLLWPSRSWFFRPIDAWGVRVDILQVRFDRRERCLHTALVAISQPIDVRGVRESALQVRLDRR